MPENAVKGRETTRVTFSLPEVVKTWADEMCEQKGYTNFSSYMQELIRRDKFEAQREAA
jgi:Arc/MetJ-type ribon-helix-helix transcriptional regulator